MTEKQELKEPISARLVPYFKTLHQLMKCNRKLKVH